MPACCVYAAAPSIPVTYPAPARLTHAPPARSEQLRQEGERRTAQFQAAVQAAVGRTQAELEAEREVLRAK